MAIETRVRHPLLAINAQDLPGGNVSVLVSVRNANPSAAQAKSKPSLFAGGPSMGLLYCRRKLLPQRENPHRTSGASDRIDVTFDVDEEHAAGGALEVCLINESVGDGPKRASAYVVAVANVTKTITLRTSGRPPPRGVREESRKERIGGIKVKAAEDVPTFEFSVSVPRQKPKKRGEEKGETHSGGGHEALLAGKKMYLPAKRKGASERQTEGEAGSPRANRRLDMGEERKEEIEEKSGALEWVHGIAAAPHGQRAPEEPWEAFERDLAQLELPQGLQAGGQMRFAC
jgi:hypothetical protein